MISALRTVSSTNASRCTRGIPSYQSKCYLLSTQSRHLTALKSPSRLGREIRLYRLTFNGHHRHHSLNSCATETTATAVRENKRNRKVTGKTAVITGGSQGSGRETAFLFARKGYNVVICAREPERLQSVADEIVKAIPTASVLAIPTDITQRDSVDEFIDSISDTYESVSVLVNNAGVCLSGSFADTTLEDWDSQVAVNLMGAVMVTQGLLESLIKSKGTIVFVNSFGGVMPLRNMTAYTSSKFALAGFANALRYELEPKGVNVSQVHPGIINSSFMERATFRGADGEDAKASMEKLLDGMPGIQSPQEIARSVYDAVENKKDEIIVGPIFNAVVSAYRMFGANPFAVERPK